MSVYKPAKSKLWQFDYQWQGHRYHGSTGCTSRRDAERYEAEHRRKIALGEKTKPSLTVNAACDLWFASVGSHLASKATCIYQLAFIVTNLGAKTPLQDVTLRDIDAHVTKRRAKLSNASVNREVNLFRSVVRWIAKRGYDTPTIDWTAAQLPEKHERIRELSGEEQERLFAKLPDNLKPLVEFALLSGQRRSEIIALRWSDVDLRIGRATLWIKGGKHHTIPLSPRMAALIKEQPKVCPQVFTYVCTRRAPKRPDRPMRTVGERYPFSKQGWTRQWRAALKAAGITDYRFHDNRHTAATRNLRQSGNLKGVQKLLGHTDVRTTSRYAHALEDDVRAMLLATETGQVERAEPKPDQERNSA